MNVEVKISLNEGLFLKEPQNSKLGKKIIEHSILLIDKLGFEAFNFKKLAQEIQSTEASIYRYFENKHLLLLYLVSWYWEWVSYLISINTMNIDDPRKKLRIIIHSIIFASLENPTMSYVNESKLHDVVIAEGIKAYHVKNIDQENSKGFFGNYKDLTECVSKVIEEVNPNFEYPHVLATNLFETSNNHIYFAKHLPSLTDIKGKNENEKVEEMLNYFVDRLLA